jgi:hypothetical protein
MLISVTHFLAHQIILDIVRRTVRLPVYIKYLVLCTVLEHPAFNFTVIPAVDNGKKGIFYCYSA